MGSCACAEVERTIAAVTRAHRETDRERAPNPAESVLVHVCEERGEGPRQCEEPNARRVGIAFGTGVHGRRTMGPPVCISVCGRATRAPGERESESESGEEGTRCASVG